MAEENKQSQDQTPKEIPPPSFSTTTNEKDKGTKGKTGSQDTAEETQSRFQVPQPFIVKVEKEKRKWYNSTQIIPILAVIISITAVVLNKCSLDNTSKSLAITDSTFKANRIKDSIAFISNKFRDSLAKRSMEVQINSIKENQRQFEIQNQSYLQIQSANVVINDTTKEWVIEYKIMNVGNQPANVLTEDTYGEIQVMAGYKINRPNDSDLLPSPFVFNNRYVSRESPFTEQIICGKISPEEIEYLKTGKERIFVMGHIKYINLVTAKTKWYTFKLLMEDYPVTGFTMIDNANDSVSHKLSPYNAFAVKH